MDITRLQSLLSTLWVVWFFVLFFGMLAYVLNPRKRQHFQQLGDIPLRDDGPRA